MMKSGSAYVRLLVLSFLGLGIFSSCLRDESFNEPFARFTPQTNIDNYWLLSDPTSENMDEELITQAYELVHSDERFLMSRSLLVFRNGKLVAESYPNDPEDVHAFYNLQSCTKSITSIMVGVGIKDSIVDSLKTPLYDVFPNDFDDDASKRDLTLRDALVMQTGLEFDNGVHTLELYQETENSTNYVLKQEKLYDPGTYTHYNDGAPHLVSKYLETKTGKPLVKYADEQLFTPLGITDWKWEAARDGTTFGAFSVFLKPRDFGKIGHVLLNNGTFKGQQLIDSGYIAAATTTKVKVTNEDNAPYGYYFWILPQFNGYAALGHGGQFLLVVPQKNLVVVYTSWPYTSPDFFDSRSELMELIVGSCG